MWLAALLGFPCWLIFSAWQAVREALFFLLSYWWSLALQRGEGGGGSFFRAFGFPEVGAVSFPDPFRLLSVLPLAGLEGQGCGDLGCRGAAAGLLSALPQHSSSIVPIPLPSSSPISITGAALEEVTLGFIALGAVELAPLTSPAFSSPLFILWKTSRSWRPVIDLSHLILFEDVSPFQMVTIQSVLLSVCQGDWMASIDLEEAYLQVPVHPTSRHFLRFIFRDTVYQFQVLCFGLSMAPQVFTSGDPYATVPRRLAGPVFLSGVSPRGSSDCPPTLSRVGNCRQPQKSNLVPSHVVQYLGVVIASTSFRASPSVERISRLQSTAAEFQSCASPTATFWLSLLGALSSLAHLVPGGRLRMRSLQLCLTQSWDRQDLEAPVFTSMECLRDLQWWLHLPRVSLPGVSSPTLLVRHLRRGMGCPSRLSDCFGPVERPTGGVVHQCQETAGCSPGSLPVPVSSTGSHGGCLLRHTTAVASLRKEGGPRSPLLHTLAQEILR